MPNTIIIDTQGNAIKANSDSAEQILQAIKMMAEAASVKQDIIIPAPVVNVNVPEQLAPVVNVTIPKQPAPVVNVPVTVQPAEVNFPSPATEATITTDAKGNKTIRVKK